MNPQAKRWTLIIGITFAALLIGGFAAFQFAIQALKGQVERALGPHGEVKEIRVSLTGIEAIGIRIRAPQSTNKKTAWPAEDQLRAERILIVPSILDLLTARVALNTIRIEGAYISMLRARDGRMKVIPSLLETPAPSGGSANTNRKDPTAIPAINIGKVELVNGMIEFFDATIQQPPLKLRLEQINASFGQIQLPDLKARSPIKFDGILKGVRQDGQVAISGSLELATKEMEISTRLRGVDLVALQPYLIKATESGIKKGTLDLDLKSSVSKGQLYAPGTLTLSDMELASGKSVMGMPRAAAVAMMKNRNGKISVKFALEGNINDPRFSLNENLTTRIGTSLAETLGISIEDLAKGVGSIGSGTVKGLIDSIGKLKRK